MSTDQPHLERDRAAWSSADEDDSDRALAELRERLTNPDPAVEERRRRYWAAMHTDAVRFSTDAVIRLADQEQAELRARAEAAEAKTTTALALVDAWLGDTSDVMGVRAEHWRGPDYVDGRERAFEKCAEDLLAALGGSEG